MKPRAIVLTYHAVEKGPQPLCLDPDLFRAHLDVFAEADAHTLTVSGLAAALAKGALPDRAVAITFDDGAASVAESAAPLLSEHGATATVFCVAGYLGGVNDWPTQPANASRFALASAARLRELAGAGFEIGSHGFEHAPLATRNEALLRREIIDSKAALEDLVGTDVRSFAYPYGARSKLARAMVRATYDAACTTLFAFAQVDADTAEVPRIDAHYIRTAELMRRLLSGHFPLELHARRVARGARRLVRQDYASGR